MPATACLSGSEATRIAGLYAVISGKGPGRDRIVARLRNISAALSGRARKIFSAGAVIAADPGDVPTRRRIPHALVLGAAIALTVGFSAMIALAAQTHRVIQKNRSFQFKEIDIAGGDVVQFINEDQFLHQIYVASGGLDFDSREQPPGDVISIEFPDPGIYEIRCHIHPKMSLFVNVK